MVYVLDQEGQTKGGNLQTVVNKDVRIGKVRQSEILRDTVDKYLRWESLTEDMRKKYLQ